MNKIRIWGEDIPFNTGLSKKDYLTINPDISPDSAMAAVFNPCGRRIDSTVNFDTAVWHNTIKSGRVSDRFDDVPYLVPYIAKESKICVLLCAGGAYIDVSTEEESAPAARLLNSYGITVFTLNYRISPYRFPAMLSDCRRAIRYLRAHSEEYGFDRDKICLGGFSAGGHLAAYAANTFGEADQIPDYTPDKIDAESACVNALLLVYAKLIFTDTAELLIPMFGSDFLTGDRKKYIEEYTVTNRMSSSSPPAFLVNSVDDSVVSEKNPLAYASKCHELKIPFEMHSFLEGGHGYGSARDREYSRWAPPGDYSGTECWTDLFAIWLKKVFYRPGERF